MSTVVGVLLCCVAAGIVLAAFGSVAIIVHREAPRPHKRLDEALDDLGNRFARGELTHRELEQQAERLSHDKWEAL